MTVNSGFVYIWYDKKHRRYYIGAHWGDVDDGYVCSSPWMKRSYQNRPHDFKRRLLVSSIATREEMLDAEMRFLKMIKESEIKPHSNFPRYYNLNIKNNTTWHKYEHTSRSVGQKISAAKKGKKIGPCSLEKAAAISAAKKSKNIKFTAEHREKLRQAKLGSIHTNEWKHQSSIRLKKQWSNGTRFSNGPLSDEHKSKISSKLKGLKRADVSSYKKAHSKKYLIAFQDGIQQEINGLKQYGLDNNIPYTSLAKASQHGTTLMKYNIVSIECLS